MTNERFMFYPAFFEAINCLPEEERPLATYEFVKYGITGELPQDKSLMMFCLGVKASVQKYQGRGGFRDGAGAPKGNKNAQKQSNKENNQNNQNNQKSKINQNNQKQQTETETKTETINTNEIYEVVELIRSAVESYTLVRNYNPDVWAKTILEFSLSDNVPISDMLSVAAWYKENINGQYTPKAKNAVEFVEKYPNIIAAKQRNGQPRTKDWSDF